MSKTTVYANQTTLTLTDSDALLTFRWLVPKYDDEFQNVGNDILEEVSVQLSMEVFKKVMKLYTEVYEKSTARKDK